MILGMSWGYHDSAIALIDSNEIIFADHEERYSRKKFDASFPELTLKEIANKYDLSTVSAVAYYEKPIPKLERQIFSLISGGLRHTEAFSQNVANLRKHFYTSPRQIKKSLNKATSSNFNLTPVLFSKHHLSHASSTFFTSNFENATVLVMDAVGEWNSTSVWRGEQNHLKNIWAQRFPHSIGLFYSAMTQYLGFKVNSGEYKLMGLAPYGKPIYLNNFRNIINIGEDGKLELNLKMFDFISGSKMISRRMETHFGKATRGFDSEVTQWHADMAATTQKILENYVYTLLNNFQKRSKIQNLCLSGGVALNCVLNGKLAEDFGAENLHIFPAAGDAGAAVGAAFAAYFYQNKETLTRRWKIGAATLGREFNGDFIRDALNKAGIVFEELSEGLLVLSAARILANGGVIGVFSGKSEFGPRALGNRSIIADPRIKMGQIHINKKIKFRESFRPFAPICLQEEQSKWFKSDAPSEFMLRTVGVKNFSSIDRSPFPTDKNYESPISISDRLSGINSDIPSVTHLDGSARIQTVSSNDSRLTSKILRAFFQITNCPVLINTSFNVRGEPIVGSPDDAIRCFATTNLDALVFDNFLVVKKNQDSILSSRFRSAVGDD